jgi:DNA-binding response OmpR family regulator
MPQQKILLLENVAAQAAGVRERLSLAGYAVAVGRHEAEGVKRIAEWRPDVILLSTAHPAGSLVDYCARVRSLAPGARIILTSSLNRERLFQEFPGLADHVDEVLLRPYGQDEVLESLRAAGRPPEEPPTARKTVAVLDRDEGTVDAIRRAVAGRAPGVDVEVLALDRFGAFCSERSPAVLVLEWPLTKDFVTGTLAGLLAGGTGRPAVLLVSGAAQDAVTAAAPELMPLVDMFFRKPVAWEHFFRVLGRHLDVPALADFKLHPHPAAGHAPPAGAGGEEELRARFQDQLEAKFLEVEELRRQLETARRPAPEAGLAEELGRLRDENARLRQAVAEAGKKSELILAMETLKRSELEVKLDNLLRMKDEFEKRAQDLIEAQEHKAEQLWQECEELREDREAAAREQEDLQREIERLLVEKERVEERVRAFEGAPGREEQAPSGTAAAAGQEERIAALTAEVEAHRAQEEAHAALVAEVEAAVGELADEKTRLAQDLERERAGRAAAAARLAQELRGAQELVETRGRELAELGEQHRAVAERHAQEQARAAEEQARLKIMVGETEAALLAAAAEREALRARCAEVEEKLAREIAAGRERAEAAAREAGALRAGAEEQGRREAAERAGLLERVELAGRALREQAERAAAERERLAAGLQAAVEERGRELGEATRERDELRERAKRGAAEQDALRARCAELEAQREAEVAAWREMAAAAELDAGALRSRAEELSRRGQAERAEVALRLAAAEAALRDQQAQAVAERDRAAAEREGALAERDRLLQDALRDRDEQRARLARLEDALVAEREAERGVEAELRRGLEEERGKARRLEEQLAAQQAGGVVPPGVQEELHRLQQLFEEVLSRARADAVDYARREADLEARRVASVEERRQAQERFDRALAEAAERERRAADLLESVLKRPLPPAFPPPERENLPAVIPVPPEAPEESAVPPRRRRPALVAGALAAAGAVLVAGFFLWQRPRSPRPAALRPPVLREQRSGVPPTGPVRQELSAPVSAPGPLEVWERWTRFDLSGGVLLQVTLRSEEELRAEREAEKRMQGWTEERAAQDLAQTVAAYRFDENYYFQVYLKNLTPGYPAYLNGIYSRFSLRDNQGNEIRAFFPEGHEKERTVYSIGNADFAQRGGEFVSEVTIPMAFPRAGLAPAPSYLQLVAYDLGATTRRVLTWELE